LVLRVYRIRTDLRFMISPVLAYTESNPLDFEGLLGLNAFGISPSTL